MIEIDGSFGEGGGQILRTSVGLSCVTGQPCRIQNIRARRARPGLLHQHLTAVRAAAAVSDATLSGDELHSRELTFRPARVSAGTYAFRVPTAGSAGLVFQTVLPALWTAGTSRLDLEGGTHNPSAPPFEFLERAFLPLLRRMGGRIEARLERYGFHPRGNGLLHVEIAPCRGLAPLILTERGRIRRRRAVATVARLPRHIAERELAVIAQRLAFGRQEMAVGELTDSPDPGNFVTVEIEAAHVTEVFTGFGRPGIRAEAVAGQVARAVRNYLRSDAPVAEHLADQILVPLALAGGGCFRTLEPTSHFRTNVEVVRRFLPVEIEVRERGRTREVEVRPETS